MCGITGICRFEENDPSDPGRLIRMANLLTHRGPDDYGYLFLNSRNGHHDVTQAETTRLPADVLFAHRRLSIIDTSAHGRQPMQNETGDVFLVFNGEIYNYIELRKELEGYGHVFDSHTDSEVIVHAYEEWGVECCKRFNGMWAYVIWDQRKQKLICSRDRFGIKPFFFRNTTNAFYFGSEIKSVLAASNEPADPNYSTLAKYVASMWRPRNEQTFFDGINELLPAHNLIVTQSGVYAEQYWDYTDRTHDYDYENPIETFRELFADAVSLRLRSDVPVSILLSGGLDSTAIASLAVDQLQEEPMNAYTAEFPGFISDERWHAEHVANRFGMNFHTVDYNSDSLVEDLGRVIYSMDAPPSSAQVLPRWKLLELVGKEGKVVLEGQGADELLAGYVRSYFKPYVRDELGNLSANNFSSTIRDVAGAWETVTGCKPGRKGYKRMKRMRRDRDMGIHYGRWALSSDLQDTLDSYVSHTGHRSEFPDHLTSALYADHTSRILPSLLRFGDSISMAHSVESRLPFMDYRLIEFVFGLRYWWKYKGRKSKLLLRDALADRIPDQVLRRTDKVGFDTPLIGWLKPQINEKIRPVLMSDKARNRGLFNEKMLGEYLDGCVQGNWVYSRIVYRCLALELWFQQYVD